ncbi:MAG: glutamine-hydrolyzing carbamoyl-phosphate synthase small subunit [Bacillota bacterium]|nr:glutamine-hydrolyzing carbamoyl-phosphate synthase small subunit [Bacillota bacterium]
MAYLTLEDGTVFEGELFGAKKSVIGEVVFNTGMTGYQEVLTDPSYHGQIVTMTYPMIGNYGVNEEDAESWQPQVRGFIIHELCQSPSNWKSVEELDLYLKRYGITGISGLDTRALTRIIREKGTMRGMISPGTPTEEELKEMRAYETICPVEKVTCKERYEIEGSRPHIAVMDYGIKQNILRSLKKRGCRLSVFPSGATAQEVLSSKSDGIFLSNGPGDPKDNKAAIEELKKLMGAKPIFGICLGHQLMALAVGADTFKLKYGHRGCNHPVKDISHDRIYITSQNHGYAVDAKGLPKGCEVSHVNWNDGTVEGMKSHDIPAFSVQFHPEGSPGPEDTAYLFDEFLEMVKKNK